MMDTSQLSPRDVDPMPLDERLDRIRREIRRKNAEKEAKGASAQSKPSAPHKPLAITVTTPLEERIRLAREQCKSKEKANVHPMRVEKSQLIDIVNKIVDMSLAEYYRLPTATKGNALPREWPSHVLVRDDWKAGRACDFVRSYYENLGKEKLHKAELEDVLALIDIVSKPLTLMAAGLSLRSPLLTSSDAVNANHKMPTLRELYTDEEKRCLVLPEDPLDFRFEVAYAEIASPRSPLSQICLVSSSYYVDAMENAIGEDAEMLSGYKLLSHVGFTGFCGSVCPGMYSLLDQHPENWKSADSFPFDVDSEQAMFMKECFSHGVIAPFVLLVLPWALVWRKRWDDDGWESMPSMEEMF